MGSRYSNKSGRLSNDKEKAIKKINERRAQIARDVRAGKLPESALDQYEAAMRAAAGPYINANGNISHGKDAQENISWDTLNTLLQRETSGQLQRDIKKKAAEEYGKSKKELSQEDIKKYISDVNFVNDQFSQDYDRTYSALKMAFQGTRGRKTYRQLADAIRGYERVTVPETNPFNPEAVYFT